MSTFSVIQPGSYGGVVYPGATQSVSNVVGAWSSPLISTNNVTVGSTSPSPAFAESSDQITVLACQYVGFLNNPTSGPYAQYNFMFVLAGTYPQNYFGSVAFGTTATFNTSSAAYWSTSLMPGCTIWLWTVSAVSIPSISAGTVTTITITGLVIPVYAREGNPEYQPAVLTSGTYDELQQLIDINWTPGADGIPQLFTTDGSYTVDPSADHIVIDAAIGGGGGGSSGNAANYGNFGSGAAGGGGGYLTGTLPVCLIATLGSVAVTIGSGGVGGAASPVVFIAHAGTLDEYASPGVPGTAGEAAAFGYWAVANGGAPGLPSFSTQAPLGGAGGTAYGIGLLSQAAETGGAGHNGFFNGSYGQGAGFGATNAGAGGGAGILEAADSYPGGSVVNGGAGGASSISGDGLPGTAAVTYLGGGGGGAAGPWLNYYGTSGAPDGTYSGKGGDGGLYGGGGGAGGMLFLVITATTGGAGAGGDGADGVIHVTTYWPHTHDPYYFVYRNGTLIGTTTEGATSFTDLAPVAGANTYTLVTSYDGINPASAVSNPYTVTVSTGKAYVSGKFCPANAFAPIMLINLKGVKPKFYVPVVNQNMRSRR